MYLTSISGFSTLRDIGRALFAVIQAVLKRVAVLHTFINVSRMDFRLQILQKYRDTKPRMERSELPMEKFYTLALQYEDEAFLVAANQQDYTGQIARRLLSLEKKFGLLTHAIQLDAATVQLRVHQVNQVKKESQKNLGTGAESIQTTSDHVNWRTLNSSDGVQSPGASTGHALGFEPDEHHLRLRFALKSFNAQMAPPSDKLIFRWLTEDTDEVDGPARPPELPDHKFSLSNSTCGSHRRSTHALKSPISPCHGAVGAKLIHPQNGRAQLPGAFSRQSQEEEELLALLQFMQFSVNPSCFFLEDRGTSNRSCSFL